MSEGGTRDVPPGTRGAGARRNRLHRRDRAGRANPDFATTSVLSSEFPLRSITYHPFPLHIPYPRVLPYDIFKSFGYRTAVFSSQNEHWAGMYNFLHTGGVDHFLHAETFDGPTYAANADRGLREWMDKTGHAGKIDDRSTIDEAISWMDSIAPRAPFFAYINLQASHNPYLAPRNFAPRFGSGRVSFPILFDIYPADSAPAVRDMYDNSLAYADAQLVRLFDALKTSGRWDSTIVAVLRRPRRGILRARLWRARKRTVRRGDTRAAHHSRAREAAGTRFPAGLEHRCHADDPRDPESSAASRLSGDQPGRAHGANAPSAVLTDADGNGGRGQRRAGRMEAPVRHPAFTHATLLHREPIRSRAAWTSLASSPRIRDALMGTMASWVGRADWLLRETSGASGLLCAQFSPDGPARSAAYFVHTAMSPQASDCVPP